MEISPDQRSSNLSSRKGSPQRNSSHQKLKTARVSQERNSLDQVPEHSEISSIGRVLDANMHIQQTSIQMVSERERRHTVNTKAGKSKISAVVDRKHQSMMASGGKNKVRDFAAALRVSIGERSDIGTPEGMHVEP